VVRSFNYDEILDFVEMTKDQSLWVRFIELMPFSRSEWGVEDFVSADEMREKIETHYHLAEIDENDSSAPARDYLVEGHKGQIGFIAPLSRKFCDHCNRIRLTADGRLLPCLMGEIEIDIKAPLRKGASDDELKHVIQSAMQKKPKEHTLCNDEKINRAMSRVGG
jgi:cyclic pyranopterin phosphate synthase